MSPRGVGLVLLLVTAMIIPAVSAECFEYDGGAVTTNSVTDRTLNGIILYNSNDNDLCNRYPYYMQWIIDGDDIKDTTLTALAGGTISGTFSLYRYVGTPPYPIVSTGVEYNVFMTGSDVEITFEFSNWNQTAANAGDLKYCTASQALSLSTQDLTGNANGDLDDVIADDSYSSAWAYISNPQAGISSGGAGAHYHASQISSIFIYCSAYPTPTPTPTPTPYPGNISVNILEKYSNAALINQAITLTPTAGGAGETKTSLYGETLHFGVVPGMEYWFNASRAGYQDYSETYTIPASPGIYNVYMERTLTPIAGHSYAHFSVVDQTNGGLIPNAEIRLSDGQTKLTNSAGYAWFSVNNSEQINYYVSKPSGYWPAYGAMNLTADESILVALQRYTGPTATATMPGWTPVTVPTTGTGSGPVVTLSAQLREQNVQEGMDVWYTNLPFISQFLFLLFIIGGLGLMAGGTRRN
jgi:hypothetical protein